MEPYNKYDLSKRAVLDVFITKEDHQLSWLDLAWIYNVVNETPRATKLRAIVADLTNKRILESNHLTSWQIVDIETAKRALQDLTQESPALDLKSDETLSNPKIQNISNTTAPPKMRSGLTMIIWIVAIVVVLIMIYLAFK